ncbi:MAG: 7TM diverse intracellular signaling domain-containing protein, partial [Planctomycetota bacterium]
MYETAFTRRLYSRSRLIGLSAFVVGIFFCPRASLALKPVILDEKTDKIVLGPHVEYLEDREGKWTIEDASSKELSARYDKNRSEIVNFGYSSSVWWFRLDVEGRIKEKRKWLLEMGYPLIDRFELFIERPAGGFHKKIVGESFPFSQRENDHRNFVFSLEILPGQSQRIYLRVDTESSVQVPLTLWSPEAFVEKESNALTVLGIFNGLLFVMVLYNLFLFVAIRDKNYLYYVLFVLFVQIMLGSFDGLPQKHLWPNFPWWANRAVPFSIVFAGIWLTFFTRDFLDTKRHLPRWKTALSVMAVLCAVASVLALVLPYRTAINIASVYGIIIPLSTVVVGFLSWRKGVRPARYFVLGWTVVLIECASVGATGLGILPKNFFTAFGLHFALAMNVILLSFALADRINIIREEKEQAQKDALDVQRNAAENLEKEVERKTLDLQQAYDRLSEHDRLKSSFFANVSHELRTPLTLILTPLERLLADKPDTRLSSVKDQLHSMSGNTHRLLRLVNQLLDFSKLESGAATVAYEPRDIRAGVASLVHGFMPFARSKEVKLELRAPDELPLVYVDPGKLDKIMSNLLSNACKFTDRGGAVVVRITNDDQTLKIAIKDTGIGIAQEDLPKIFERFRQADGGASRRFEGTGIGLALSKELVELMGGTLAVNSDLGVGSTFTVSLPLGRHHIQDPSL